MIKIRKYTIGIVVLILGILVTGIPNQTVSAAPDDTKIVDQNAGATAVADNPTQAPVQDSSASDGAGSIPEVQQGIVESNPLDMEKANQNKPDIPATTYHEYFSFQNTRVLKGTYATTSLYFNVPEYWDIKYVYVGIAYDTSRLIKEDVPASLTFLVNNIPVYSCSVNYTDGREQMAYFKISTDLLKQGYNVLDVTSYVRIFDSEGCSEDQSDANWINLDESSYIYAGYELKNYDHKISFYPYPFISTANPSGEGTGILVSDAAADGELAAAMYLMADISTETGDKNLISVGLYKEAQSKGIKNKIVISLTKNLPQDLKQYLKINIADTSPNAATYDLSSQVMLRLVDDPAGNPLLIIVADKEENLMEAVHMLLDKNRVSQEKISTTFVKEGSAKLVYESMMLSQLVAGSYTIKDITGKGMTYIGPFHTEQILYLPFGNDYVLSSAGKISLKFRYSDNLNFSRSLITVYWGDVPIASKKLTRAKAASDELSFTMPADVVGSSASSIKIAFDLEIPDLYCTMRQDQMPWAYITGDSVLYLPSIENTALSFDYFPSPFQTKGIFSDVLLVVSDSLPSTELELLGKAIAMYGYEVAPYGNIKVIRASEFNPNDADYNIITVGTTDNSFIKGLNDKLYFKYNQTGDAYVSNEKLVLSDHYARDIAAFQLLKSPYAAQRAIFTISATGGVTLLQAQHFLELNSDRWELTGDCVLLDSDMDMKSFTFIKNEVEQDKPNVQEFIKDNKKPIIFTAMAGSAMVMLLSAAVLILIRARRYRKKEDK